MHFNFPRLLAHSIASLLLLTTSLAVADDRLYTAAIPLPTPKKATDKRAPQPYDSAPIRMWLPPNVKTIRGVVVNPFYEKTVEQEHWRAVVAQWDFALVGTNFFGVEGDEFGEVMTAGMQLLAKESDHAELAFAPMCFVGMSAGGGMSTRLTEALPERTLAAGPVCLEVGPRDAASEQVPIITVFGERDGHQMERLLGKLPAARADGAQWAIAVQWGQRHEFARANNMVMPWFDRVIDMRRGDDSSLKSAPKLSTIDTTSGYVGLPATWEQPVATIAPLQQFQGDRSQTCWLPDAYLAHVWQAMVTPPDSPLRISEPAGMGDGDKFQTYAANEPITVRVKLKGDAEFDSLTVYDGNIELAKCTGTPPTATLEGLPAGVHALIVQGERQGKLEALSPPNTIVVE